MLPQSLSAEYIRSFVETEFNDVFVVQTHILRGNKKMLSLTVDTDQGIGIDQCARINRAMRRHLEEAHLIDEAFEIMVSSPGLSEPLRLPRQYRRHTGRAIAITTTDGQTVEGILAHVSEQGIELEPQPAKQKPKAPQPEIAASQTIEFQNIKQAKVVISF